MSRQLGHAPVTLPSDDLRQTTLHGAATMLPPLDAGPYLRVVLRENVDEVTLQLHGEVDIASGPSLERELLDAERRRPRRIVLDLGALDFVDSTGVHLLEDALARAEANAHELAVSHVPEHAGRLFNLTGLDDRLTVL